MEPKYIALVSIKNDNKHHFRILFINNTIVSSYIYMQTSIATYFMHCMDNLQTEGYVFVNGAHKLMKSVYRMCENNFNAVTE